MHGNERMPVSALADAGLDFILANPKAYKKNVRFTEQDLNASFGTKRKNYESKRAAEILREIGKNEVVIDFHTSASKTPFQILIDKKMISLAERTGIKRTVLMKHNIKKGHALINYRDGISIEAGAHTDKVASKNTLKVINSVKKNKKHLTILYEVFGEIRKPGKYVNWRKHPEGFIPVLANEPEYERSGLFGLKARRIS